MVTATVAAKAEVKNNCAQQAPPPPAAPPDPTTPSVSCAPPPPEPPAATPYSVVTHVTPAIEQNAGLIHVPDEVKVWILE
jgi:hypothetical protein